ncbi:uncharacterized protein LOC100114518 [Nasonia vitripennis]|uniref:Uncharacterized protein n=1 Tax=Nasonia vitripennis TaxID=7425 RepID=A0A7M7H3Y4_NASVI|nr:uncharacterized protein LOC100114518 [Nasonia vitripennis]XP_008205641.1 uncharacterized protein LOC100114518 [Nasonia vitripennis]XP_016843126.1 uncharacterized protein LOC100114518 [Nasonia vitripennis]XP_016843127.1 uncharacterized protein LOC100114518 [Nasonia vitripennis]
MEAAVEVPPKKPRLKQNLQLSECIRQFELPQQYPSTITERLAKPGSQKSTATIQTKSMQNIISALPFPGKMKFIPNKEVLISDSLQKLKFKLPDGRDVGEVKIVLPGQDEKSQTKVITMSKIGKTNEKPITWTIKSPGDSHKPRIKTITKLSNGLPIPDDSLTQSDDTSLSKMKVQFLNGNNNSSATNGIKNVAMVSNLKRLSKTDANDSNKQNIIVHNTDGGILKKLVIENPSMLMDKQNSQTQVFLKKLPGSQKMVMLQRDGNQLMNKPLSLKPITQSNLQSHNIKNNAEKIIFKSAINGSIIRKKEPAPTESTNHHEKKRSHSEINLDDCNFNGNSSMQSINDDQRRKQLKLNNSTKSTGAIGPRKNIMVIVPNEEAEKLSRPSSSAEMNNLDFLQDDDIINLNEEATSEDTISNIKNSELSDIRIDEVHSIENEALEVKKNQPSSVNNDKNAKSQDRINQLNILKQAVLSVQDADLRAKALKALKDCGIKVKKTVPAKRPMKMISESTTQTEVFSLLKNDEFLQINNESEDIVKIKHSHKMMKQSINTLSSRKTNHNVCPESEQKEFKMNLDKSLEKLFPACKGITDVKDAFEQNKKAYARAVLKQLEKDYKAARKHDDDGLLGIHKAVLNNSIQEVQRHMLMLKAAKQHIDVPTLDNKTSLELAVEFEMDSQIVKILLDAGAQPVSFKPIHDSAVIIAAKTSSKILHLLLKYITRSNRSLLNRRNSEGLAVIHYLAQNGNLEGITELLKHGVDVNLQDSRSGRTALFYAVETKNSDIPQEVFNDIAHKLLEHEAVSNIPTFSKHSVLSMIDDVKSHALKIALNKAVK